MRICDWANEVSTNHIGVHGSSLVTVEQLRLDAALAYEKRQYTEAYRIYNQIVNQYPKEGDPYYRMAIMLYKNLQASTYLKETSKVNFTIFGQSKRMR